MVELEQSIDILVHHDLEHLFLVFRDTQQVSVILADISQEALAEVACDSYCRALWTTSVVYDGSEISLRIQICAECRKASGDKLDCHSRDSDPMAPIRGTTR